MAQERIVIDEGISREGNTIYLDGKTLMARKLEMFPRVSEVLRNLKAEERLVVDAPFKPTPLIKLMRFKGYQDTLEELGNQQYRVTFWKG